MAFLVPSVTVSYDYNHDNDISVALQEEVTRQIRAEENLGFQLHLQRILQEQEETMRRHNAPGRRHANMPPFEQLHQNRQTQQREPPPSIEIRSQPIQWTTDLSSNWTTTSTTTGGTWWNTSPQVVYATSPQVVSTTTSPAQREEQARRYAVYLEEERVRQARIAEYERWTGMYAAWHIRNKSAKATELNTRYGYFKKQKNSIEVELLKAIYEGKSLNTKTTTFNAPNYTVSLYGYEIAKIDRDTCKVIQISFPRQIDNVNLYRHRLRQLGVRCLKIKDETRIYFDETNYSVITPGMVLEIPYYFSLICLPKVLYEKSVIEIPRQLDLVFNQEWQSLKAFDEKLDGHPFKVSFIQDNKGLSIKGVVTVKVAHYDAEDIAETVCLEFENARSFIIKFAIEKIRNNLSIAITKYTTNKTLQSYKDLIYSPSASYTIPNDFRWSVSGVAATGGSGGAQFNPGLTGGGGGGGGGTWGGSGVVTVGSAMGSPNAGVWNLEDQTLRYDPRSFDNTGTLQSTTTFDPPLEFTATGNMEFTVPVNISTERTVRTITLANGEVRYVEDFR